MDPHEEFLTLFMQHQPDLRAFIGSVVRDRSARDDVMQETALVLWREFERYDRARPFGGWARGIAAKMLLQRLDRGVDRATRQAASLPLEALPSILAAYERIEDGGLQGPADARREALDLCLTHLPDKSRTLLALRYEQGLSLAQVAERVHSTLDAVHKALSRIRIKLQECIERQVRVAARARGEGA